MKTLEERAGNEKMKEKREASTVAVAAASFGLATLITLASGVSCMNNYVTKQDAESRQEIVERENYSELRNEYNSTDINNLSEEEREFLDEQKAKGNYKNGFYRVEKENLRNYKKTLGPELKKAGIKINFDKMSKKDLIFLRRIFSIAGMGIGR